MQKRLIAYFSEKLNGAKLNYLTYDKKLHTLVRASEVRQHYLRPREFVIHMNHKSPKHLKSQGKLGHKHIKWVSDIFSHVLKYKKSVENVIANVLSRRYSLFTMLNARLLGLEHVKSLYLNDENCGHVYAFTKQGIHDKYFQHDDYLFYRIKLYILKCSLCELLIHKSHDGGLMGRYNVTKTFAILQEHFFWPYL